MAGSRPSDVIRLSCNDGTAQMAERAQNAATAGSESFVRIRVSARKRALNCPARRPALFSPSDQLVTPFETDDRNRVRKYRCPPCRWSRQRPRSRNGGTTIKLTLLSKLYTKDGKVPAYDAPAASRSRMSCSRAKTAKLMLELHADDGGIGNGHKARRRGRRADGRQDGNSPDAERPRKTATARPISSRAASAFFPANDPQIILYIAIVKPVGETFGGSASRRRLSRRRRIRSSTISASDGPRRPQ